MRTFSRWQRLKDVILSTDPKRRTLVSMALLALVLMTSSSGVMLLVAHSSSAVNATAVQWWAAMSVGGLVVMTAFIRSGETARLRDPSLTIPQMVWTITSGAVAYVLAGDARGLIPSLDDTQQATLQDAFDAIVAHNLAGPQVYVHRDFMTRNLMAPVAPGAPLGVLDFQDAVYGPITYDIASLLRDAFISWEEEFVIDITVRYWEKARKSGLLGATSASGWGNDFGEFYRSVEWMGLQRHLKVAGIFARLTLRDGKPKYLADAPRFMHYIRTTTDRYRQLGPLLKMLDQIEGTEPVTGFAYGRM